MSAELNELKCREEEWDSKILSNLILMNRVYRPDEWSIDELASMALTLEARVKELEVKLRRSVERANMISYSVKSIAQNAKEIEGI